MSKVSRIESVYPLSPLQAGLFFHTAYAPESGVYVEQFICTLHGNLDTDAFRKAWQRTAERHAVLRTLFRWSGSAKAVQVVLSAVDVPVEWTDLQGLAPSAQRERLDQYLTSDRRRGFDLSRAPLTRLQLFQTAPDTTCVVWTNHHLLLDGWSVSMLIREVAAEYGAIRRGQASPITGVSRPYRDYIAWLLEQDTAAAEAYWRAALGDVSGATPLGLDRPLRKMHEPSALFQTHEVRITEAASTELAHSARRHGLTLNTLLQGAWTILLSRYSGHRDVMFGVTVAGRPASLAGVEDMVGLFINMLPLRAAVPDDEDAVSWMRTLQQQQAEMRQHEYSALVDIHGWTSVPRGQPLFESVLVFENFPLAESAAPWDDLSISGSRVLEQTHYPVTFIIAPGPPLVIQISYDAARFDPETIVRIGGHWETLLRELAANPERPVSELPVLPDGERQRVLTEWNATALTFPESATVDRLLADQAARTPGAVALTPDLTYGELEARANQLAHYLRAQGVGPETRVGVCLQRSHELVVALIAILKAGGAYVPLDPAYPRERLSHMLRDAGARVLLTSTTLHGRLPAEQPARLDLDRLGPELARMPSTPPASTVLPGNLAYVIYTSGSTGTPKGVMITHRSAVAFLTWARETFTGEELARVLAATSVCFDISVFELFAPLIVGGSVEMIEDALVLPADTGVTLLNTVPSAMAEWVRAGSLPASVRTVNLAGEPLQRGLVDQVFAQPGVRQVLNLYGPTEATTYATVAYLAREDELAPSIGRPVANTQVYLLDGGGQPTPIGVAGELFIGGVQLARGYLGRPGMTAERFVPDPFGAEPGGRLYRTGDLARWRPDGQLEFLGRRDQQVKLRGFRVELGEIEAELRRHPAVGDAAVVAQETGGAGLRLVAYIVGTGAGGKPTLSELRRHLQERLPDHMIPAAMVWLEALPLTPNGKLDRKALPAPDPERPALDHQYAAPRTAVEGVLAEIWSKVLGVEPVGIEDNFFELGGDSIRSLQIVARAMKAGLRLSPRQVFQHQTIAELARVSVPIEAGGARAVGPAVAEEGTREVPLTPIQQWFFEAPGPEPHHWNQAVRVVARERLRQAELQGAIDRLVQQHDALRLRFERAEAGWRAVVIPAAAGSLTWLDLSGMSVGEQEKAVAEALDGLEPSLELARGPLMRVAYCAMGAGQADQLLIVIHHLAVDLVSWSILLEDLETAYRQLASGVKPEAVELVRPGTSFAVWAAALREESVSAAEKEYWSGGVYPGLPRDGAGGGAGEEGGARMVRARLEAETTRALVYEVPGASLSQVQEVLLTGMVQVLLEWSGERRVAIDVEGHGREEIGAKLDVSRTVGWFTTMYPVRVELSSRQVLGVPANLLKAVKEQFRAVPRHGMGYGQLRYQGMEGLAGWGEISFNYLGVRDEADAGSLFGGARVSGGQDRSARAPRRHLLDVAVQIVNGELEVWWSYNPETHGAATIESLADRYLEAVRGLVASALNPLADSYVPSDFPLAGLDQDELKRVVRALRAKS